MRKQQLPTLHEHKVRKLDQKRFFTIKLIYPTSIVNLKKTSIEFNENSSFTYLQLAAVKA
jgi:hypothetical protein